MAGVYMCYTGADSARATLLLNALTASGWEVWAEEIPPQPEVLLLDAESKKKLNQEKCVLLLWSKASVSLSFGWFHAAQYVLESSPLSVVIDDLPPRLRPTTFYDLRTWSGAYDSSEIKRLNKEIAKYLRPVQATPA